MNDDYVISIISTIGDVKREFKLEDILRHNSSLLSLQYSEVRQRSIELFTE